MATITVNLLQAIPNPSLLRIRLTWVMECSGCHGTGRSPDRLMHIPAREASTYIAQE